MEETCVLRPIAHVHSEFPGKFGIPRQSGVVPELRSELIFTPEFRNPDALRGIEGFDRLWLIWEPTGLTPCGPRWTPRTTMTLS